MINEMKAWADILERYGRHGDTMLAHISTKEADLLERRRGGKGPSYNPATGKREFWGGDDSDSESNGGTGDSVGGFGDHGSLGGGNYSESPGTSPGDGNDPGNNGLGFGNFADDRSMYAGAPESEISERDGGVNWAEYNMQAPGYKAQNTWGRALQEIASPSVKASRFSTPTATNMGLLGPAMGFLAGPVMGLAMMGGAAMGRAQSPEEQAASMAHNQALGAQNSTGQDINPFLQGASEGVGSQPAAPTAPTVQDMKPARMTPESWDEEGFLARNPEVKAAVGNGTWSTGYDFDQAYKAHAGVPYEAAMSYTQPDKYSEDLLATRPGQIMPYKGY